MVVDVVAVAAAVVNGPTVQATRVSPHISLTVRKRPEHSLEYIAKTGM